MKSAFEDADNGEFGSESDEELLQDVVQYSSSSVDRSSIGSIPWADDAIKQNQLDWERVERMLTGEESLPDSETELRNEILEWQKKFPQLLGKRSAKHMLRLQSQSFDSSKTNFNDTLDIDSLSNLSLNSSEDGDAHYDDDFPTPTQQWQPHQLVQTQVPTPTRRTPTKANNVAIRTADADSLGHELCINSVPLTLSKRQPRNAVHRTIQTHNRDNISTNSSAEIKPLPPPAHQPLHHQQQQRKSPKPNFLNVPQAVEVERLRMPPILNVLESKRRFCGLTGNRSFVQLTQVQQAKSAVVSAPKQPIEPAAMVYGGRNKSAWHMPLAAATVSNRFFNNRNAIILPAINLQRIGVHHATSTMTTSETVTTTMTNSDSAVERSIFQHFVPKVRNFNCTTTNSTTTPSTGGRSISAAVHPRSDFHTFYLPYSAAKFKSFK